MITNVTDKETVQAATIESLRQEVTAWSVTVTNLEAKLAELEQEANEEDALRERLSGLLTKSVNAIRGEPAELSLHSWHDLPELCNGLVEKLAELEKCLQDSIDCNLNKLLAMSDEQITALTRLDGSNPDDVAALARKAMQCAVLTVERDELRADLDAERDAAELKSACITGMRQEITDWATTVANLEAELERERMRLAAWRLAACGVVALADTPDSAIAMRKMHPDYESASCDEVKRRVDECMALRAERDALRVERDALAAANRDLQDWYDAAIADAKRFDWLTADLDTAHGRARRNQILDRISTMSYSAACTAIDAAMKEANHD